MVQADSLSSQQASTQHTATSGLTSSSTMPVQLANTPTQATNAPTQASNASIQPANESIQAPNVSSRVLNTSSQVPNTPGTVPLAPTHKTHLPQILDTLKSLPFKLKLSMNKEIESKNKQRATHAYKHALDPIANPDPSSEAASMITITSKEFRSLSIPSVMSNVASVIPLYLLQLVGLKDAQDKRKRDNPQSLTDSLSSLDARIMKRRCMDGTKLVPRSASNAAEIVFPQILFDTELELAVPLSFFTHSNLRYIIDNASTLPTRRANGKSDGGKGPFVIDVDKLVDKLGCELSIDYGQYIQASHQFYRFQSLQDLVIDGSWTKCWYLHFQFFEAQHDAEEFYPHWKEYELQLRRDRRSLSLDYNETQYDLLYSQAKNNAKILRLFQERESKPRYDAPRRNPAYPTKRGEDNFHRPFQAGGGRSSAPSTCIICAERHSVFAHPPSQQKFSDGKTVWAKIINNQTCTPDNKEICINFNLGLSRPCNHGAERVHVCSLCGSKGHHAFSWTCRSSPN